MLLMHETQYTTTEIYNSYKSKKPYHFRFLPPTLAILFSFFLPSNDFFLLNFKWSGAHLLNANHGGQCFRPPSLLFSPRVATSYLFVFLHCGIQFLREVIGYIGHAWLLLVAPTQAALVFAGFLIIFLFSIFAISLCHLQVSKGDKKMLTFLLSDLNNTNGKSVLLFFETGDSNLLLYQLFSQTPFF